MSRVPNSADTRAPDGARLWFRTQATHPSGRALAGFFLSQPTSRWGRAEGDLAASAGGDFGRDASMPLEAIHDPQGAGPQPLGAGRRGPPPWSRQPAWVERAAMQTDGGQVQRSLAQSEPRGRELQGNLRRMVSAHPSGRLSWHLGRPMAEVLGQVRGPGGYKPRRYTQNPLSGS